MIDSAGMTLDGDDSAFHEPSRRSIFLDANPSPESPSPHFPRGIPGLSLVGSWRAQVEAVRIDEAFRGHGLGEYFMQWCVIQAKQRQCSLLQLTTDKARKDAHRFYERFGFVASHEGMKLRL